MSVMDAVASVREVQSTLQTLFSPARPTVNAANAAGFADALAGVQASETAAVLGDVGGATGTAIAEAAKKYVGVPYLFGGEDMSGMDCSGLVQRAFAELGIEVPRLARDQEKLGTEVPSLAQAKPGDLIVTGGSATTASALAGLLGGMGGTTSTSDPSTALEASLTTAAALQAAQAAYARSAS